MSFTAWAPHARARKETDKPIPEDASTMTSRRSLFFLWWQLFLRHVALTKFHSQFRLTVLSVSILRVKILSEAAATWSRKSCSQSCGNKLKAVVESSAGGFSGDLFYSLDPYELFSS